MEKRYLVFKLEGNHVVKDILDEPEFEGIPDEKIIEASRQALNFLAAIGKPYTIINNEVVNVNSVQSLFIETIGGGH